jgi:aldoxime dehydratase
VDSAIAPHLRRERVRPTRKGEDFQPPYPSFSARFPTTTVTVVMAYFGVQYPGDKPPAVAVEALATLRRDLAGEHGAGTVDLAAYVDEAGYGTRVAIAYWDDPDVFDAWNAAHPWTDAGRTGQGVGFFAEVLRPGVERFETLFSSRRLDGVATLSDGLSDEIREHGYWGGARDRFPAAQDDALEPDGEPVLVVDGPLRTVRAGVNPCLIRSGQEFGDTAGDERAMYLDDVEPHLRAGMDYLRDDGRDVGCYLNRYMTVVDGDWNPTDETFGLSWWRGLEDLDTWAESHPTHLAIFGAAMKYLSTMGPAANLHLFHEVTVPGRGETEFVYLDCHDRTGMLRAVL